MPSFRTVSERATARFEIRGSEFLGHVAPASDRADAESFVTEIREMHPDATHNVPAYRVPADETSTTDPMIREYADDDGEPSGSAGDPALNVLQQRELRNLAVVVTRYYGGTNLGVGGLARAYGRATKEAVAAAGVTERQPHERIVATTTYDDSGTVRSVLESTEQATFEAEYDEQVRFDVRLPVSTADTLRDRLRSVTSGRIELG